MAKISQNLKKL